MKKIVKLKENRDFRRAYNRADSYVSPFFVTYIMKNRSENVRLGITVGKKIGGAVQRNRAKRVITAAFRENLPFVLNGHDFVIVARTRILELKSDKASQILASQIEKAGILCGNAYEEDID